MSEKFEVEADERGKPTNDECEHLGEIRDPAEPKGDKCEQCEQAEQTWNELRACLTCGYVGCDDQSPGKHASQHWHDEGHPIVRSLAEGDTWAWCYEDELLLERGDKARHLDVEDEGSDDERQHLKGDINVQAQQDKSAGGDSEQASEEDRPKPSRDDGNGSSQTSEEDRPKPSRDDSDSEQASEVDRPKPSRENADDEDQA